MTEEITKSLLEKHEERLDELDEAFENLDAEVVKLKTKEDYWVWLTIIAFVLLLTIGIWPLWIFNQAVKQYACLPWNLEEGWGGQLGKWGVNCGDRR